MRGILFGRVGSTRLYDYRGEKGILQRARDQVERTGNCPRCLQGNRIVGHLWDHCKSCEAVLKLDRIGWQCEDCAGDMHKYQFADFDVNDNRQTLLVCLKCWRRRARMQNAFLKVVRTARPSEASLHAAAKAYEEADAEAMWIHRYDKIGVMWINHVFQKASSKVV